MKFQKTYPFVVLFIVLKISAISYANNKIFDLEGISQSCEESLNNSLESLPRNIRWLLTDAKRKGMKFKFKKVSFEEAQKTKFAGTVYGVPIAYASSDTIFISSEYCPRINGNLTHEIGHIIHSVIKSNYPTLANEWSDLWQDIYRRNTSSSNSPTSYHCPNNNCAFIGWKDLDNENEGFAQLIHLSTDSYRQYWEDNTNPDFLLKLEFLSKLHRIRPSSQ